MHAAEMHRDLGLDERPDDEEFDDFILHVDGWLCEIKDAQIRDGLHVLGQAPAGEARVNLVLAILRAAQVWGGADGRGARPARGARPQGGRRGHRRRRPDRGAGPRRSCEQMEDAGWDPGRRRRRCTTSPRCSGCCSFAATQVVPRLARTTDELDAVLHALDGGFIPAGPSGSPLRGLVNVLPTGRNFYTVDPRAVPSRLAWETGVRRWPTRWCSATSTRPATTRSRSGSSVWGTSAMRTSGDDIAEVLALLGVRPVWDEASRRVSDLRRRTARGARPSAHRRDRADLRLLPRRVPARRGDARRRRTAGGRARRAATTRTTCARTRRPTSPSTATSGGRPRGSSAPSPGRTAPASCSSIESGQLARRRRPRRGLHGLGRLRLRARARRRAGRRRHARQLPADQGRGQEHRHPRARHRRLRRLLPVPRRHGRHRACADRRRPEGVRRRLDHARRRPHPHAAGGDQPRLPRARGQPALDRRRCSGTATRAPSSWPRPSTTSSASTRPPAWCTTGCTTTLAKEYVLDETNQEFMRQVEPVGAARHRREAARGRRPRAVGGARPGGRWPRCSRSTSSSRATWRTDEADERSASSGSGWGRST